MALIKLQKSGPYFSRYQVKYKRRRQGKTDYAARKKLIMQAKNKYNSPKYRLVVRFTNKDIIVQVVYAKIQGDVVLTSAYAHELPRYGIKALQKLGLDEKYEGVAEPDGTLQLTEALEEEDSPRPFKCYLDAGLKRTSTGSKVFGALKGASDGGIYIPHSDKRFPGYDIESKELDAETLKKYIYGGHVAEYMEALEEEDEEKFRKVFSRYLEDDIGGDDLEEIYTEAHAKIREDPSPQLTDKSQLSEWKANSKKSRQSKLSRKERQDRIRQKIAAIKAGAGAAQMDQDDDEDEE